MRNRRNRLSLRRCTCMMMDQLVTFPPSPSWPMQRICTLLLCLATLHSLSGAVGAEPASPKETEFFEQKIRPVLVGHCYGCHSHEAQANKKLQARACFSIRPRGCSAAAKAVPPSSRASRAESLLIKALKYDGLQMPPTGKLSADVIADFAKWIDMGAPDPRKAEPVAKVRREIDVDRRAEVVVISAAQVGDAAAGAQRPAGADAHRPVRHRRASQAEAEAQRACGEGEADSPGVLRSHRPAAVGRAGRSFRPRRVAAGVREGGGRAAGQPALRREMGPALARCGPLRGERRLRVRWLSPGGLSLSRLGHSGPQRRSAVRPIRALAARRRSAPAGGLSRGRGRRVSRGWPLPRPDHREDSRAHPLRPARRHVDDDRRVDARPDAGLRPLPRAQVRSDPAAPITTRWPRRSPARSTGLGSSIPIRLLRRRAWNCIGTKGRSGSRSWPGSPATNCPSGSKRGGWPSCPSSPTRRAGKCSSRCRWTPSAPT